jgi:hypothetical protein
MTNDLYEKVRNDARTWGFWGSLGGLAVATTWGLGMFAIGGVAPQEAIARHPVIFRITFLACFFGPLIEIGVLVALAIFAAKRSPMRAVVGGLIALMYVPLNLSCYFLNGALQPRLLASPAPGPLEQTISTIIAMEHRYSLFFALDVMGYALLGIGLSLCMSALWGRSRLWTAATVATFLCTLGSVGGTLGIALDNQALTNAVVAGGVFAIFSNILTALAFRAERSPEGALGSGALAQFPT